MSRNFLGMLAATALSLSACVESKMPIITDAKPLLGQNFIVHLYEDFADSQAGNVEASVSPWEDGQYVRAFGRARDVNRFVAEPLDGNDFVIQSTDAQNNIYLYWIGRRLT